MILAILTWLPLLQGHTCPECEDAALLSRPHQYSQRFERVEKIKEAIESRRDNGVPCTYSKTYAYPATVVQQDSGGILQMEQRCAEEGFVNNDTDATCILNSNSDGYDYDKWTAEMACPYPAGATEFPTVTTQRECKESFIRWKALGQSTFVELNGKRYMLAIGHGALTGVRGNCVTLSRRNRHVIAFQALSFSLEKIYRSKALK